MALALLTFQTVATTLNVGDQARAYVREADDDIGTTLDLDNTPSLGLELAWPTTTIALEYAPRFSWLDVFGPDASPTLLLHTAGLRLSWQRPRTSLWLAQRAVVGDQSYSRIRSDEALATPPTDAGAMPPDLQLIPHATVVDVTDAQTSAGVGYDWTRRWHSAFEAAFAVEGGSNAESQQLLPRQRSVRGDTSLVYRLTPREELNTELGAQQIHTSNGFDHWLASLTETWSTRLPAESGAEVGAGLSLQDTDGPPGTSATRWVPLVTSGIWYVFPTDGVRMRLRGDLGYQPDVNVLSGSLQNRLYASAQAGVLLARSNAYLTLAAAKTFPHDAPDASDVISADLTYERTLLDWLHGQLGGELAWQQFGDAAVDSRWMVYAGLQVRLPSTRL
jgi:hypothetical protein